MQGQPFEVTVIQCNNLDDKEWFTKQDPYVSVEYGNDRYKTKTCKGGGTNPTFSEKFHLRFIGNLKEVIVVVWNSHTFRSDNFIGSARIPLYNALTDGFDDATWPIYSRSGRNSGAIRLVLCFPNPSRNRYEASLPRQAPPPNDPPPGTGPRYGFYPPPPY